MFKILRFIFVTIILINISNIYSMIDNRFLPLYRQMYTRTCCKRSASGLEAFVMFGNHGFGFDDDTTSLPEVYGRYDLIPITKSLEIIGKPNPLSTQFRLNPKLELDLQGNIGVQGLWLGYEQNVFNNLSVGVSFFLMHIASKQKFLIPSKLKRELQLRKGKEILFDRELRQANELLGINNFQFNHTSPSDIDIYLRFSTIREYFYKFRKIDAGISLGFLFPSGEPININNPASIPFGGDGHFGIYGMTDITFDLKEDLTVGFWLELLKRLPKNQIKRIPVNENVPVEYGAIIGQVRIDPGLTVGFSPFVAIKDIRDGFGFKVRYNLVYHAEDNWKDLRRDIKFKVNGEDKEVKTDLGNVEAFSKWSAEYLIFSLTYDFSEGATKCRKFAPIVYLEWYRPTKVFLADRAAKTNRVSFGFEFNF